MIPRHRIPTSPGEILDEEFLRPLGLTQTAFARHLGVPVRRINEIVRGKRAVSPETAQLFAAALGTSPEFWMNAQSSYDLATHRIEVEIEPLVKTG
ncbi:MAG TPA: HigA family addiction module antitoxin [Planctomycetota bacterium]|mgnify:CR=1 FL=1|nr:HigA family addiction module antitoxin [Planctomycetota bacterium]HRR82677.1 HigA family addiction module antitoxin [Planctomycetota bacterium]HRT93916.1 HigA family addiction module antitoxin [Planctomycetota bacterium]